MQLKSSKKYIIQPVTFRKWGRKSYSLFRVLHREVKIAVLSVVYFMAVPSASQATEQDTTGVKMQYDLEEIEVSAQRSPAMYPEVARIISVITRKEIESAPARSVQELLVYVAGVDVRQRGAEGVQADVSIRGGTFDQLVILLNGINITDPQTGHHNLNLPVGIHLIEQIEILEGPAARIYGPNAFSGAINIVTKKPEHTGLSVNTSAGSFGLLSGGISGTFSTGGLVHLVSADGKRSDGYIANTDFETSGLFYSNQYNLSGGGQVTGQLGISGKAFGANSFYTPKYPNQFEETKTLFASVKAQFGGKYHITPVIWYRRHQDRFELFRNNQPAWYTTHNHHLTHVSGASVNSWFSWDAGKSSFGAEYRDETIYSNVLGLPMDKSKKVPGEKDLFTKTYTRNTWSGFFEHVYYYGSFTLSGGMLINHIPGIDSGWKVFPGVETSLQLNENLKIFSSWNTSLRMPTFTDLYYSGPANIGNPDLVPEKTMNLEGGIKFIINYIQGHGVVFYRKGRDIIDWTRESGEEIWQPRNLTLLNSLGTEVNVSANLKQQFGSVFPGKVQISYFHNRLTKDTPGLISNYVLDHLRNKISGSVQYSFWTNVHMDMRFVYQEREGTYTLFTNGNWGNELEYSPFWLFDTQVGYTYGNVRFYVSVNNILNKTYLDIGNVEQPGRWLKTGIAWDLRLKQAF